MKKTLSKTVFTALFAVLMISLPVLMRGQEDTVKSIIYAEHMPVFPGGEYGLRMYIAQHVVYPEEAIEKDIQGTVYLRMLITETGEVGEVEVIRGVDPLLDNEAVRVLKSLPKFKPGTQGGKPIPVWYALPIVFSLNSNEDK